MRSCPRGHSARSSLWAMSSTLADQLVNGSPRETSGSRSSNRFDYQKDWTICRVLELHATGVPYLVICDYHEDVLILDAEDRPTSIASLQVKTKDSGDWTEKQLLKRQRGARSAKLGSILGKLHSFAHSRAFVGPITSIRMVSNARFELKTADGRGPSNVLSWRDLCPLLAARIEAAVRTELNLAAHAPLDPGIDFETSSLGILDHSAATKGRLAEFFETNFNLVKAPIVAVYRALFDIVKERSDVESVFSDFSQLRAKKGLPRSEIERLFQRAGLTRDRDADWTMVSSQLIAEQFSYFRAVGIRAAWQAHEIAMMDTTQVALQSSASDIRRIVLTHLCQHAQSTLTQLIDHVEQNFEVPAWMTPQQRDAIALMEAHDSQSTTLGPQFAQRQP